MLTCLLGADPPARKKCGIPRKPAECKKERKKERKTNRKEISLHKTLERAEGYSEIIQGGSRSLERGIASVIVP